MKIEQEQLIGQSNAFLEVIEQTSKLAPLSKPVLIIGERGTGKELIAKRLHYLSRRWDQQYITVNCAALNENLLESELFGHDAGAFTGASKRHEGKFERAHGGTLFLDELATSSAAVQEKLLRVIEYGEFERVGGKQSVKTDVRLICATNEDLPSLASRGKFRADLLDRLAFDVITLPPMRYRKEDILLLANHFALSMVKQLKLETFFGFSAKAKEKLLDYPWPGNVRELKNVIERSVYRHGNEESEINQVIFDPFDSPFRPQAGTSASPIEPTITPVTSNSTPSNLPSHPPYPQLPFDIKDYLQNLEKSIIQDALKQGQFNQRKTAKSLSLSYHQLRGIMKKYSMLDNTE